jgi:hypothetical protein
MSQLKLDFAMYGDCFKPGAIRRTHVGVMLMFFQQLYVLKLLDIRDDKRSYLRFPF